MAGKKINLNPKVNLLNLGKIKTYNTEQISLMATAQELHQNYVQPVKKPSQSKVPLVKKRIDCPVCNSNWNDYSDLRKHMLKQHISHFKYTCSSCGDPFWAAKGLRIHDNVCKHKHRNRISSKNMYELIADDEILDNDVDYIDLAEDAEDDDGDIMYLGEIRVEKTVRQTNTDIPNPGNLDVTPMTIETMINDDSGNMNVNLDATPMIIETMINDDGGNMNDRNNNVNLMRKDEGNTEDQEN